jgi:hypothetical protein
VSSQGDVTLAVYDLATQLRSIVVLHERLEVDDHNAPALLVLPDGRYLAAYTRHGSDRLSRFRRSTRPGDPLEWMPEVTFEHPATVTYSNLYFLAVEGAEGRIYNFARADQWDPNIMISDDLGQSWQLVGRLVDGGSPRARPYVKYQGNGRDTIHFVLTEDHPNRYNTSLYHGYLRGGKLFASDGSLVDEDIFHPPVPTPEKFTQLFSGGENNVAWPIDLQLDAEGRPCVLFSVLKDALPRESGKRGFDHRYHFARWDGSRWRQWEIAYAGTRLYPGEPEYTGLGALHPQDPLVMAISTNADPSTGESILVGGQRRWEIFLGRSSDGGKTWHWKPLTKDSAEDNLRPMIVAEGRTWAVIWLRGKYITFRKYQQAAVAQIFMERDDSPSLEN